MGTDTWVVSWLPHTHCNTYICIRPPHKHAQLCTYASCKQRKTTISIHILITLKQDAAHKLFFKVLSENAVIIGWSEHGFWRQGSDKLGFRRLSFSRVNLDAFCAFDDPHGIHRRHTDSPLALQYPLIPPSYLKVLEKNSSSMAYPRLVSSLVKAITSVSSATSSSSSVFLFYLKSRLTCLRSWPPLSTMGISLKPWSMVHTAFSILKWVVF